MDTVELTLSTSDQDPELVEAIWFISSSYACIIALLLQRPGKCDKVP